jgi:hypothetical protein
MLPRSQYSLERLLPTPDRLSIHPYNDILDNRRSDSFVSEGKVNVGRIAAVEFKDGPHCGTHLLALHVGGVTGHTQSAKSDQCCDHCVVSARAARRPLFRHGADLIVGWVCVNHAAGPSSSVQLKSQLLCEAGEDEMYIDTTPSSSDLLSSLSSPLRCS